MMTVGEVLSDLDPSSFMFHGLIWKVKESREVRFMTSSLRLHVPTSWANGKELELLTRNFRDRSAGALHVFGMKCSSACTDHGKL